MCNIDHGYLSFHLKKQELPYGLLESYSNALKSSNRNKSRYKGIFPCKYHKLCWFFLTKEKVLYLLNH